MLSLPIGCMKFLCSKTVSGDTNFGGEVRRVLWNQLHLESVSEDTNYERTSETAGTSSEFTPRIEVSLHD
jgi:hypothetical protein